jgi:transcriptional regulator with XRE-family HTH domain
MDNRGLSNMQLSKLAGVDNGAISRWRRNHDMPSHDALRKVAPHLGVLYGDLQVAAGLAYPEELGVSGSPPPPGAPLPLALRRVIALLLDTRIRERDKLSLLVIIDKAVDMWETMLEPGSPRRR